MPRPKPRFGAWSITPLGVVLLTIIAVGAAVAALASGTTQNVAFAALVVAFGIMLGGGLSGGRRGYTGKSLATRRAEFGPRSRRHVLQAVSAADQDEAWRRERERRAQRAPAAAERSLDIGLD